MSSPIKQIVKITLTAAALLLLTAAVGAHGLHLSPLSIDTKEGGIKTLAFRDFEWEFIGAGDDGYYIKSVGAGLYLGERSSLNLFDAPSLWRCVQNGGDINLELDGGKLLCRVDNGGRWALSEGGGAQAAIVLYKRIVTDKGHVRYEETREPADGGIYVITNPGEIIGALANTSDGANPRMDAGEIILNDEDPEETNYVFFGELLDDDGNTWFPPASTAAEEPVHTHEGVEIHLNLDHMHGNTDNVKAAAVVISFMTAAALYAVLAKKKKTFELFSGLKMTVIGGVFLAASLLLALTGAGFPLIVLKNAAIPLDPAWAAVVICGYPLLYLAVSRLIYNKGAYKISSALLISIAMAASVFISQIFAAGQVAFIMAIGAILEDKTVERAKKGLKRLIGLAPERGRLIKDGKEETIPAEQVKPGDVLRVLPGEAIPVDGAVLSGSTSIDQSIITGESLPVDKNAGDPVFCGTINRFGSVDITAQKVGEDSSLRKLIRLVEAADENKAPLQKTVDKWAVWLVPATLVIAALTYFFTRDIVRAVTIAIVFCPCALALATPTSIMAAIGQAAKHGVIIKSGGALERMGKAGVAAFDKTGTLTYGSLEVSAVEGGVLQIAASLERYSEHPIAKAITAHYTGEYLNVDNFIAIPGVGVEGDVGGKRAAVGRGGAVTVDGVLAGHITVADKARETAPAVVAALQKMGVESVMLTGDTRQAAEAVAEYAGIKSVYAELLPAQKSEMIQALQAEKRVVCMVGDGVNDAPALKAADVGVAMGTIGSDMAIEAADVALTGDDISKIPYLKRLSDATLRLITFNIAVSMCLNMIFITLSVLGLLTPVTGAFAHNAGSVLVVLNAALLYDRKYI